MLNENLISIRQEKKLTQSEVADFLQVKRQTYSAYERGVSVPDANTLCKLATYFNVSSDYLLGLNLDTKDKYIDKDNSNPAKSSLTSEDKINLINEEFNIESINSQIVLKNFLNFTEKERELLLFLLNKLTDLQQLNKIQEEIHKNFFYFFSNYKKTNDII